jgi:hypothetical protein
MNFFLGDVFPRMPDSIGDAAAEEASHPVRFRILTKKVTADSKVVGATSNQELAVWNDTFIDLIRAGIDIFEMFEDFEDILGQDVVRIHPQSTVVLSLRVSWLATKISLFSKKIVKGGCEVSKK